MKDIIMSIENCTECKYHFINQYDIEPDEIIRKIGCKETKQLLHPDDYPEIDKDRLVPDWCPRQIFKEQGK